MDTILVSRVREANEQSLRRLQNHPFVQRARRRELYRWQALLWILAAGYDSRVFREMLEQVVGALETALNELDPATPKYEVLQKTLVILRENLDEENGNGDPKEAHWRHYIDLAHQVGLSEEDLLEYEGRGGVLYAVGMAQNVHHWSLAQAIGYMLVNEGATPITYRAAEQGLGRFFHLITKFFQLHIEVDEHHVAALYKAAEALPNEAFDEVLRGIEFGERGMHAILDEAFGVFGSPQLVHAA